MMRSLYSGVAGLTNHQTKMDVIGNNIANVNTYGFKASRAMFKDVFYQSLSSATAGTASFAGNNPTTVGYGVQLAGVTKDMSMSSFQSTGRTLDLGISGEGFFITARFPNGAAEPTAGEAYSPTSSVSYTRMGNMGIDSYGNLVAGTNTFLLGTRNSAAGLKASGDDSADELLKQKLTDTNSDGKVNASDLTYENVINVNYLIQEAYNIYTDADGFLYTKVEANTVVDPANPGNPSATPPVAPTYLAAGEYYCNKSGEIVVEVTTTPGTPPTTTSASVPHPAATPAAAEAAGAVKGTFTYSDLGAFTIGSDGVITTMYNNKMKAIARIDIAVFDNQEGLVEDGNTAYSETTASGNPKIKMPGDEGAGSVQSGKLEMSNVNLAGEFSDMIVTQRGFQANSRIITVSDSMLEELVNLKR